MGALKYNLFLAVANILFGATFSLYTSLLAYAFSFRQLFAMQMVASAAIFIPIALLRNRHRKLTLEAFGTIFVVALLVVFGWWYMLLWGASYTNPVDASTISTLGPIFTLIINIALARRAVRRGEVCGILLALLGVTLLLLHRGAILLGEGGEGYGNVLVLCAVVAVALNTVLISPELRNYGTTTVMGWYYAIGILLALPMLLDVLPTISLQHLSPHEWGELLYILLLGTALPMYLLYVGSEHLTATHTAIYRYLQPVVATILTLVKGKGDIDSANIIGAALILFGIISLILPTRAKSLLHPSRQRR